MVLLMNLNSTGFSASGILMPVMKVVLFVAAMFYIGARYIPLVLKAVAKWESRELFLLTVTALGLGIGYLTYLFELSFAFGAFMAGLVLSESDYGRRALSDLIPVREFSASSFSSPSACSSIPSSSPHGSARCSGCLPRPSSGRGSSLRQ